MNETDIGPQPLKAVNLVRATGNGRYGDVLDVVQELSEQFGSPPNALAHLVRESETFRRVSGEIKRKRAAAKAEQQQ